MWNTRVKSILRDRLYHIVERMQPVRYVRKDERKAPIADSIHNALDGDDVRAAAVTMHPSEGAGPPTQRLGDAAAARARPGSVDGAAAGVATSAARMDQSRRGVDELEAG